MKKICLSIFSLSVAFGLYAQFTDAENTYTSDLLEKNIFLERSSASSFISSATSASVIWEENFSNGFPQGWTTYSNNTQSGLSTCPWVWTLDGTWGWWNTNNATSASNALASTTASNGFLISDTDSANHFQYGQPSGSTYEYIESSFTTSAIDLSLHPFVSLAFEHLFRYNNLGNSSFTPPTVYVSTDSINWTPFLVNDATSNNTQSSNPIKKIINITPVAGGQSTVFLKFGWVSRCYYWMIDDIQIIETPENLIEISDVVIGGYWLDYINYPSGPLNNIIGLDYSITPLSQLANHPYAIEGVLRNLGAADQTSMLKYEVTGSGSYLGSSLPTSILAYSATNTIDSAMLATTPLSPTIGTYNIAVWGESDSAGTTTVLSDTVYKNIEVSEFIYAKDLGSTTPSSSILGGPGDQWHYTTRYEMYANELLYSVRVYIGEESVAGAQVRAIIYEVDTTAASDVSLYVQSDNYTITTQDLGSWINIPITDAFLNPVSLFSSYAYEVGLKGFQSSIDSSFVGTSGTSMYNGEHSLYDEFGLNPNTNGTPGTPTWYYSTRTPMIRLNFDPASATVTPPAGLEDLKSNISIYPNPSNGVFSIELDIDTKCDVNIYNILGQTIYTNSKNSIINQIDLSAFGKGVYTVEIKSSSSILTEKIIFE